MKLIKTEYGAIFNWNEFSNFYLDGYKDAIIVLKNGREIKIWDFIGFFLIEKKEYRWDDVSMLRMIEIIIKNINNYFREGWDFFDIAENKEKIENIFVTWFKRQSEPKKYSIEF